MTTQFLRPVRYKNNHQRSFQNSQFECMWVSLHVYRPISLLRIFLQSQGWSYLEIMTAVWCNRTVSPITKETPIPQY